ncbi:MAG: hypothetical protein HWN66_07835 [Candidatus Helarchaeota archaeon]|nr:hypothetical protein [Candidatus Helarchaeota archaeon]
MTEEIDLKSIERKAYTSYHQDGLIDIMIGITLIWFTFFMLSELFWLGGIIIPTLIPVYIGVKQKLTIPRIGYVKFGMKGKGRMYVVLGIIMVFTFLGLLFAIMFAEPSARAWIELILGNYYNLIIAGIAGGLTLMMAMSSGITRFYLYAALSIGLFIIAQIFNIDLLFSFSFIGVCFIVLGIITLIRFLRENPISVEGV